MKKLNLDKDTNFDRMDINANFASNNDKKTVGYQPFYFGKNLSRNSQFMNYHQSIEFSDSSKTTNSLKVCNVRDRIVSLVQALEYISMDEI